MTMSVNYMSWLDKRRLDNERYVNSTCHGHPVVLLDAGQCRKKHHHVYNSGIVSYFGNKQITIDSGTYTLRPDVTVVLIVKEGNGAYYQRQGRLSDISTGKRVHLKSRGVMVYEIEVER